jgi:Na+:H+ antiporter, NhaA family
MRRASRVLFAAGAEGEARRLADVLRKETVGGVLLLLAALAALIWANSGWGDAYTGLRDATVGPAVLHLDLTIGSWAADGLLAIFFFVAGLELKREFVAGELGNPARAALPVAAAIGGMLAPALIFIAVNAHTGDGALRGWAIPVATDIAFALAVLAVIGRGLPAALRTFLLTLAVVDDLLAIIIIAVFFTSDLHPIPLVAAAVPLGLFALLVQRRVRAWWLLLPLAAATWGLVHASGVHATVAGVLLGFAVPVRARRDGTGGGLAEHFEHGWRPISAGVAVPVFAFFAAGVSLGGASGLRAAFSDPITIGVITGLILGKAVGVLAGAWLTARLTRASLSPDIDWPDVAGVAVLAGIGFTVSLLIGELAYGADSARDDHVKVAVLTGSLLAAALAAAVLTARNRAHRRARLSAAEGTPDDDAPDDDARAPALLEAPAGAAPATQHGTSLGDAW